ncbi:hypothetical protein FDZ74_01900 [bacterium]|nr:MAG: hypothetical protein FDZ74_01900 [bacterium]
MTGTAERPKKNLLEIIRGFACEWERPWSAAFFALILYGLLAAARGGVLAASVAPYYNYLADAFLHGQLNFRLIPPSIHDLVQYKGALYPYWGPLPAVLMMPLVLIGGVGASDVLFTVLIAAVNVGLVAAVLRAAQGRGVLQLKTFQRGLLVIFFAMGTVHLVLAPLGRVWFTGQLVGFLFAGLAYWAAFSLRGWKAFLLAGAAMASVVATRNHMLLVGIFPAWFLLHEHWHLRWKQLIRLCLLAALPILLMLALLGWYNWARFANPLEVGLPYHNMDANFWLTYGRYGAFNLHYLPVNFYYQYIFYPFPFRALSTMGGSLFLLSPLFFAALWALWKERRSTHAWVLLAAILAVDIPILLLMGTGWVQFGPRYTLDFTMPLLLLTGMGIREWRGRLIALLVAVSVLQYVAGYIFLSAQI